MSPPKRLCSLATVLVCVLGLLVGFSVGQRPSNASVCDYYATAKFGANNSDTQRALVRRIVSLAFEGGSRLTNKSNELTGIWRPGKANGIDVNLLQYFNGSKQTTNVNNAAIAINWMDQGGPEPLANYLAGDVEEIAMTNSSNQFHLFGNFFVAFSRAFGCTLPFPPLPDSSGPVNLAYAHKFMNLDYNQLSYFINQLTQATMYFGFSGQDAETLRTRLNSLYNVRCAPGVVFNAAAGPQLLSLCQNPTCPLAAPVADCGPYENLTANGIQNSNPSSVRVTSTPTPTNGPSSTSSTTSSSSTAATSDSSKNTTTEKSDSLGAGAIAGVAVGGAAVLVLLLAVILFFFRRKRRGRTPPSTPATNTQTAVSDWQQQQHQYTPSTLHPGSPYLGKDNHYSYYSHGTGPPASEHSRIGSPVMAQHGSWQHPVEIGAMTDPPVEMDSSPAAAARQEGGDAGTGQQQQQQQQDVQQQQEIHQQGQQQEQQYHQYQQQQQQQQYQQQPQQHSQQGSQYQNYRSQ
ncbi:hypothetical protein B0H63DRAFT_432347 [Podospora didyma]|uniref:Uncharacterized protein n=1 Tax=Podospora didyma TaxID=330526 RepID=A0AAE0TZ74_9PEZI|nr:hypothetical protein B0H63DRAFT_432347 [Podospora didyma]